MSKVLKLKKGTKEPPKKSTHFRINFGQGKVIEISSQRHLGFFIEEAKEVKNLVELNDVIREGLKVRAVEPLLHYLGAGNEVFATITGYSPRTVSRWKDNSYIGTLGSKALVEIDNVVARGIEVMGNEKAFKDWLDQPNSALGDAKPIDLLATPYGTDIVREAIDGMAYGNIL